MIKGNEKRRSQSIGHIALVT